MSHKLQYAFSFFQDEKLKKLVELHGSEDWKVIASLLTVSSRSMRTHVCTNEAEERHLTT